MDILRDRSYIFFFSSRRRHTRWPRDWSSDVCSSDLQFNSMVYGDTDAFNHMGRYSVLMSKNDAHKQGLEEGEAVVLYNKNGVFQGFVQHADIKDGNVGVLFPEGNYLVETGRSEERRVA